MADHTTRQILDLAMSPGFAQDGIGFLATTAGLEITRDGGQHWSRVPLNTHESGEIPVTAVACAPDPEARAVALAVPGGMGISRDRGDTWAFTTLPDPSMVVTSIALSPSFTRDATLYAGTVQDGVLCSHDGGTSWQAWNSGLLDHAITAVAVSAAGTVFAGTDLGTYVSRNHGRRWHLGRLGEDCSAVSALAIGADDVVLAGTDERGVWCSRNAGATWSRVADERIGRDVAYLVPLPDGSAVVAATEAGLVLISLTVEATPRPIPIPVPTDDVVAIALVAGRDGEGEVLVLDHTGHAHRVEVTI